MATYAIGDIQGCRDELADLLDVVQFDPSKDRDWFVGDLVNRGPDSVGVLRLIRQLGDAAVVVLGNHDIHLLAAASGVRKARPRDTLADVLDAKDCKELVQWLRERPLLHYDKKLDTVLVHAGIPPGWDLATAQAEAKTLEKALRKERTEPLLRRLYGNTPALWSNSLEGHDRMRYAMNAFTRMRFVAADGALDFEHSGPPGSQPATLVPWYRAPGRLEPGKDAPTHPRVVFGHWAALRLGETPDPRYNVLATDTGCIWGGLLSAVRLEDECWFSVASRKSRRHSGE